jgi:hypothetical protein
VLISTMNDIPGYEVTEVLGDGTAVKIEKR